MQILKDVPLAPRTTLRLGGSAHYFVEAANEAEVAETCEFANEQRARLWVLGGGSNVVVPDAGLEGVVLALGLRGVTLADAGEHVRLSAQAGEPWDAVVAASVEANLWGVECLSGIPGQVGATPIQNVGAYGQEVAETLEVVRAFDREQRSFVEIPARDCGFSYRDSRFKSREPGRYVVTEVRFLLSRTEPAKRRYPELAKRLAELPHPPKLRDVRSTVVALRRSKSMVLEPGDPNARSCGSFFLNPIVTSARADTVERELSADTMPRYPQADGSVKLSAAWLIERSGLPKGLRHGNVGISSKHALALVCHDGASSDELIAFSKHVQEVVRGRTGVELHPEPQFL